MNSLYNLSEQQLIDGCLKNDRRMQELLYRKFANEMYSICLAYEPDRDLAKDIFQEAFVKVFKNINTYDNRGSLKGWIRRIITNTAIDHYRQKVNNDRFIEVEKISNLTTSNSEAFESLETQDILSQVKRLPERARIVFNLFALEGFSHKEIAEMLCITEGTSKSQFSRARQLLQEWIKL